MIEVSVTDTPQVTVSAEGTVLAMFPRDTTATAAAIESGKTAYVGGEKVTGTAALTYNPTTEELTLPDWSVTING